MSLSLKSAWIYIDDINCSQCRNSSKKFDASSSSTFQNESLYLTAANGGQIDGYVGKERIDIGGIAAISQGVLLINKEHGIDYLKPDGIFGLGFSNSADGSTSIISTLYAQQNISHMAFSIYLDDNDQPSDLPVDFESMLIIDGHNLTQYAAESSFTYINAVNSSGAWQIDFDYAYFDGINITSGKSAIVSVGTSLILGPKDAVDSILKRLHDTYKCSYQNDGNLYCNCDGVYPDFILQMSGVKFVLKSTGYLLHRATLCLPTFNYTGIANTWVLGEAFMRRFYTYYDMENMKIGFATVGSVSQISVSNQNNSNGTESSSGGSGWRWEISLAIILSALVFLILLTVFLVCFCVRLKKIALMVKKSRQS